MRLHGFIADLEMLLQIMNFWCSVIGAKSSTEDDELFLFLSIHHNNH